MIVTIAATGRPMTIGSIVGHGLAVIRTVLPVSALQIPSASADFLYWNTNQKKLAKVPNTSPAITPAFVAFFQYIAAVYIERNAAAVIPNHIDVPTATILPGRINPRITAIITAIRIPMRATFTEDPLFLLDIVSYMSLPRAVPCTWNWAESVDIAAESRTIINTYANHKGMAALMNVGMTESRLPPAA